MDHINPNPEQILKSAKTILLVDWPAPDVPRALLEAGFTVFGYSPDSYSAIEQGSDEKLVFRKLGKRLDAVDIIDVYRPDEELPEIISKHVVPLGAKVLWLHPPVTSAKAKSIAAELDIAFIEGVDIAEVVAKI